MDVGGKTCAFGVEDDNSAETGFFEHVGVDKFHLLENGEEFFLDVEGWEGAIWEGFKPSSDPFQEIVVDDRLS